MIRLIADSGSTKTDWLLHPADGGKAERFQTSGLNPCLMSDDAIRSVLAGEVIPHLSAENTSKMDVNIDNVYFYGAGCRPDQTERMASLLRAELHAEGAEVASDLLGAARALCGRAEGIVAILGTGSGSAVYDGERFVAQTPSLGYVLGDEGSGAVLGRRLVGDVLKGCAPAHIIEAFHAEFGQSIDDVIRRVYREPGANRYLAQFTHLLSRHSDDEYVHGLVVNEFCNFFVRNIRAYHRPDMSVNCVGSIAHYFARELEEAALSTDCKVGKIIQSPVEGILEYHLEG